MISLWHGSKICSLYLYNYWQPLHRTQGAQKHHCYWIKGTFQTQGYLKTRRNRVCFFGNEHIQLVTPCFFLFLHPSFIHFKVKYPFKKRPLLWNMSSVWVALTVVRIIMASRQTHWKPSADLWLWLFFAGLISPMQLRPNITEFQPKIRCKFENWLFYFFFERIPFCSDSIKIPFSFFSVCVGGRHFKEAVMKWSRPDEMSVMELFL